MHTNRSMPSAVIIPELPYLYLGEAVTKGGNPNPPFSVMVRVDDFDAHYGQAAKSGAWFRTSPQIIQRVRKTIHS